MLASRQIVVWCVMHIDTIPNRNSRRQLDLDKRFVERGQELDERAKKLADHERELDNALGLIQKRAAFVKDLDILGVRLGRRLAPLSCIAERKFR